MHKNEITSPEVPVARKKKVGMWGTFGEETSFHGFQYISSSTSLCRRCFWTCVLVAFFGILTYQVVTLVSNFLSHPTMTSVEMQYPASGIQLPNFTVCTLIRGKRSTFEQNYPEIDLPMANFLAASFLSVYSTTIYNMGYFPHKYNQTAEGLRDRLSHMMESNGSLTPKSFFEGISFPCPELFIEPGCWYQNSAIFECCNTTDMFLSHNGPCYTFNMADKKQWLPGPVGGFGFKYWHPNDSEIVPFLFNSYMERAIHVFTSPEDAVLNRNGVAIQPGTQAHVTLEATTYKKIRRSYIYPECHVDKKLMFFPNSMNYSSHRCQLDCVIQQMLHKCNCTGLNTFVLTNARKAGQNLTICSRYDGLVCFGAYVGEFNNFTQTCRTELCPVGCAGWDFKASVSVGKAFHNSMEEETAMYLQSTRTVGLTESLIVADFYYSDICYRLINEGSRFTIETFVSNLGGALGLWCGASIITLVHLLFFVVNTLFYGSGYAGETKHDVRHDVNGALAQHFEAFMDKSELVALNRKPDDANEKEQ